MVAVAYRACLHLLLRLYRLALVAAPVAVLLTLLHLPEPEAAAAVVLEAASVALLDQLQPALAAAHPTVVAAVDLRFLLLCPAAVVAAAKVPPVVAVVHQLQCVPVVVVAAAADGLPDQSASLLLYLKVVQVAVVAMADRATLKAAKALLLKQQMLMLTSDLTWQICNAELSAPGSHLADRNHVKWL